MNPEQLKKLILTIIEGLEQKIESLSGEISTVKKTIPNVDKTLARIKPRLPIYGKDWKLTREEIEQIAEKIKPIAGRDFTPPKDGKDAVITEALIAKITKMVQSKVRDGRDGKDGARGEDGEDGLDGSPDEPKEIVKKLNTQKNAVDWSVLKDFESLVNQNTLKSAMQTLENQVRYLIQKTTSLTNSSGGGATTPALPFTSIQFNDDGAFGGDSAFTWNKTTNTLTVNTIDIFSPATNSIVMGGGNAGINITAEEITVAGFGGFGLLSSGLRHTGVGFNVGNSITTGNGCTLLGHEADVSFGNIEGAIAIGSGASVETSHSMVIGGSVDYINLAILGNGASSASPQDITIRATGGGGASPNIQGGDMYIGTGLSTGNAVSGTLKLQVSEMGASGTGIQAALDVFTAVCTSASGAFLSMGDPTEVNNKTKLMIHDANETIDMELDGDFTIRDTSATVNRVAVIDAVGHHAQFGDFDGTGNEGLLDINDNIHTHYATTVYVKAPPSPVGSVAFQVDTGTNPTIQMGDIGLIGNGTRFVVYDGITQVYVDKALFWVARGTDVASANDLALPFDGNLYHVTGTTTIQRLDVPFPNTAAVYGTEITLFLDGNITIEHGVTTGVAYAGINLAGSVDWAAPAGSRIKLFYDNSYWYEISRTSP